VPAADASDLYGLPLDQFVPERGALAKALRGAGDKEEAARVAALRKPSVAAWTVNQLVRTQHSGVAALFDAGNELQRVQADLLAGCGDARALRDAMGIERRAVDELAGVARGLLSSEGQEPTQATLDRVSETLHAAALDEDARARVRGGCLERELRQVGFGPAGLGISPPPSGGGSGRKRATDGVAEGAGERERERAAAAQAERERATRLKAARGAVADARRHAELTTRQLRTAQERRDRAAAALGEAEEALTAARDRAEEAEIAHQRAQATLEGL
jgi:hypothetical protein